MEDGARRIKDGRAYDHLFPKPTLRDHSTKKDAGVEDTIRLIQRTVPKTLWHTEKIAKELRGRTLNETCSNIWHFVYEHIQYKRDEDGVEQVRSPRRTWWDRETGVDCDCYTEFISSILLCLKIPHKARITKYPLDPPAVPRWQHIYPIVPKDGRLDQEFDNRDDYIVIDCVKRAYNSEQPFLEYKDYDMRLDYLDGIEEDEENFNGPEEYDNADASELASLYDDDVELGKFKLKNVIKKVNATAKKGLRVINRYTNPGTIVLRNGFLLAMKINLFNVAGRLRYGYLTDEQATAMNMDLNALKKVRHIKDRAESIYWQAGGKKENLKKAILHGKGNKNKKVPLSGLYGMDEVYADQQEYNIIHSNEYDLMGLGEPATGASIAAATSVIAALGAALKQVKGLFKKGGGEEKSFQAETDKEDTTSPSGAAEAEPTTTDQAATAEQDEPLLKLKPSPARIATTNNAYNETSSSQSFDTNANQATRSVLPAFSSSSGRAATLVDDAAENTSIQTTSDASLVKAGQNLNQGFMEKATTWVKANKGMSFLLAGAVVGAGYLIVKSMRSNHAGNHSANGLSGTPKPKHHHKHYGKKHYGKKKKNRYVKKVQSIKL